VALSRIFPEGCLTNKRLSMRKIHEFLRLHFEHGRSTREIARTIGASPTTVSDYLARARLAGLSVRCVLLLRTCEVWMGPLACGPQNLVE